MLFRDVRAQLLDVGSVNVRNQRGESPIDLASSSAVRQLLNEHAKQQSAAFLDSDANPDAGDEKGSSSSSNSGGSGSAGSGDSASAALVNLACSAPLPVSIASLLLLSGGKESVRCFFLCKCDCARLIRLCVGTAAKEKETDDFTRQTEKAKRLMHPNYCVRMITLCVSFCFARQYM